MKSINKILQLNKKWVRAMLVMSVLIIVGLSMYPDTQTRITEKLEMPAMEMIDDSITTQRHAIQQEPIQIQIITETPAFDWKAMISWVIGAVNGVVLLVMNIKNIRKK